ncbi:MAG: hypothetical protein JSV81_11700 [Anaerolineales bacterium]|nr:MAG: hypothetical protein JSV81_11700 [Anaerolineales bacterium]
MAHWAGKKPGGTSAAVPSGSAIGPNSPVSFGGEEIDLASRRRVAIVILLRVDGSARLKAYYDEQFTMGL